MEILLPLKVATVIPDIIYTKEEGRCPVFLGVQDSLIIGDTVQPVCLYVKVAFVAGDKPLLPVDP